jgi:alanyl-tRNA synthetase
VNRLYYTDPLLQSFDATVIERGTLPDGRAFVVLDQTAFYPTSGGQPHDLGVLGGVPVTDVIERDEDGAVLHVVERWPQSRSVTGTIDVLRRVDHVQQHSGQHLLSAAFIRACDAPTVSFHMGADVSTIDLTADLDAAAVAKAEDLANEVVRENRPVHVRFVSPDEAASLPLRKEPKRAGTLRLVDIVDWDLSACGGTHVSATGAIGPVLITGWERYKGGTRVGFVCGERAIRHARGLRDTTTAAARHLSVLVAELPEAIVRIQAEQKALRHELRAAWERIAGYEGAGLAASAVDVGGLSVAASVLDGRDGAALKALAQAVAASGAGAVLVSASRPCLVVAARGARGPLDASAVIKALIGRFGGKGGGRPELAQAGGLDGEPAEVLEAGLAAIRDGLPA